MKVILGFGKTEKDFEKQEFNFVEEWLNNKKIDWFEDDLIDELRDALIERETYYNNKSEEYENSKDYPDRYSRFFFDILNDYNKLCVVFEFYHINRKHPMSPDGWGLMKNTEVFYADVWNYKTRSDKLK